MATNYDDVISQLRGAGLQVDSVTIGRMTRCKVEGDREKRGWYMLHEIQADNGDTLIVGSYGIWRGAENNAQKLELKHNPLTAEQRGSLKARLAEDRRRAERMKRQEEGRAAARAAAAWKKCAPTGESPYLVRKGVLAHGLRFSPSGALVVPMLDVAGRVHGLQIIRSASVAQQRGKLEKEFWPKGLAMRGHFHLVGMPAPGGVLLVTEGYATGATLHEATGLPVAIAFSANNLAPVCAALHRRYKQTRILVCADDDDLTTCPQQQGGCGARLSLELHPKNCPSCGIEHGRGNAGVSCASVAALEVGCAWMRPVFADRDGRIHAFETKGTKLTDFNDLHAREGLHIVRAQVEARVLELGWSPKARASASPSGTGGRGEALKPVDSLDELIDRYALIYGHGGTVFDYLEHCMLQISDMRDACLSREAHRAWMEHPDRKIVRISAVGFDPTGRDTAISCNLFDRWPTVPKAGRCDRLLALLRHMCSGEPNAEELYRWLLCWVAYPLQHSGAKIRSTVVIHGPQGTGKSMFFEAVMDIYGQYGSVIGQHALEDKHNDWASRRMLLIADEVVARSDLYHVKNTLKSFVTGKIVRINPKHVRAYDEKNHCNIVFLSNELMPVVLEEDDRRHAILWTPDKLPADFYDSVQEEIDAGGVAALHDHLMHLDLAGFTPDSKPPMTQAKRKLIDLSMDSTSRFHHELVAGEIDGVKARPALANDIWELYGAWCSHAGLRTAPKNKLLDVLERRHRVPSPRKRYMTLTGTQGPHSVFMYGAPECPPGISEQAWLGDHIESFRADIKHYKGSSNG